MTLSDMSDPSDSRGPQGQAMTDLPNGDGEEREDGLFPAPVTAAPQTGDLVIDEALAGLEESARSGDLDAQVEAGNRVHRELQERLDDLGGA